MKKTITIEVEADTVEAIDRALSILQDVVEEILDTVPDAAVEITSIEG